MCYLASPLNNSSKTSTGENCRISWTVRISPGLRAPAILEWWLAPNDGLHYQCLPNTNSLNFPYCEIGTFSHFASRTRWTGFSTLLAQDHSIDLIFWSSERGQKCTMAVRPGARCRATAVLVSIFSVMPYASWRQTLNGYHVGDLCESSPREAYCILSTSYQQKVTAIIYFPSHCSNQKSHLPTSYHWHGNAINSLWLGLALLSYTAMFCILA